MDDNINDDSNNIVKKSLKKNYIYNLIYQIFVMIVPLVTTPYISRVLSAEGVGRFSFTSSLQDYFTLFATLGFGYYAQRLIAFNQNDKDEQSKIFWEIILVRLCSTSIAIVVNLILYFSNIYKQYSQLMVWWNLSILAVAFDITFLFQGNEDYNKIVIRNIIVKLIIICLVFVLVKNNTDVWIYVILTSGANLLGNFSLWACLPKYLNKINFKTLHPLRHIKPTIQLFIPTIAGTIYTVLDKTLIGLLIKDTYTVVETEVIDGTQTSVEVVKKYSDLENGYYAQSEKIVKICIQLLNALGTIMVPRNSKLYSEGKVKELKDNIYFTSNYLFVLGIPMALGLIALAPLLVPWFLGDGYSKCINLIPLFTPLVIIIGFSFLFGLQYLIPTGRDKKYTIAILIGAFTNLILNCVLIPFFWSYGAVIASLIAEFAVTLTMYLLVRKEISIKIILLQAIKPLIAGIIMFIACYFIVSHLASSFINILIIIIAGALIYFILLLVLKEKLLCDQIKKIFYKLKKKN